MVYSSNWIAAMKKSNRYMHHVWIAHIIQNERNQTGWTQWPTPILSELWEAGGKDCLRQGVWGQSEQNSETLTLQKNLKREKRQESMLCIIYFIGVQKEAKVYHVWWQRSEQLFIVRKCIKGDILGAEHVLYLDLDSDKLTELYTYEFYFTVCKKR